MSKLRPEIREGSTLPGVTNGTAYLMILNAVETKAGLIHGALHDHGESCAVGSFYDVNKNIVLYTDVIDEVAAVNDSMPTKTPRQRKEMVARWLRWRLTQLGMPGFCTKKKP